MTDHDDAMLRHQFGKVPRIVAGDRDVQQRHEDLRSDPVAGDSSPRGSTSLATTSISDIALKLEPLDPAVPALARDLGRVHVDRCRDLDRPGAGAAGRLGEVRPAAAARTPVTGLYLFALPYAVKWRE